MESVFKSNGTVAERLEWAVRADQTAHIKELVADMIKAKASCCGMLGGPDATEKAQIRGQMDVLKRLNREMRRCLVLAGRS